MLHNIFLSGDFALENSLSQIYFSILNFMNNSLDIFPHDKVCWIRTKTKAKNLLVRFITSCVDCMFLSIYYYFYEQDYCLTVR